MAQRPTIEVRQTVRLKLTTGLQASLAILRLDAMALEKHLEEQAAENPALVLIPPAPRDWLPRWEGVLGAPRGEMPEVAGPGPSLMAHVLAEIDRRMKAPRERQIALALAEALAPSGWLDRPLAAIAREVGGKVAEVEAVLLRLQEIEPVGLFARDLAECLKLQAQEAGICDRGMKVVLAHLDLLARGETGRIAALAGISEAEVLRRFRRIRTMNPKPGTAFDALAAEPLREPDLTARRVGDDWQVEMNRSALPEIRVGEGSAEARASARGLERMVVARGETLLRVGAEIMRRQRAALEGGPGQLAPMTMAEVAAALGLHESTVSRVVAGAAIDTPRGVWWLRKLFSTAIGNVSAAALREALSRQIAAEDRRSPLSDEALSAALSAALGVPVARRTVAKYRTMLGIPVAGRRKARGGEA